MRKTVCKKLRKLAIRIAPQETSSVRTKIKRYFTGKFDDKGKEVVRDVRKNTVISGGRQRMYQFLKKTYNEARRAGRCVGVGSFLARRIS